MRRNRRKKRIIRLGILAALLAAALAVLFLFRVKKINVYGNSRHSSESIADGVVHNMLTGNTLYLQWEYRNGNVPDTLPFLSSLKVKMKSPSEIDVEVSEKALSGYVDRGENVCFDADGVVLEITDQTYDGLPVITGAAMDEPVLYQKLPTQSSAQLRTILSVTQLLRHQELAAEEIRFEENGDITVYVNGVEAMLGQDEYMEEKIANLRAIIDRANGEKGTLHLESFTGKNDAATFRISDEPETETDTGAGDGSGTGGTDGSGTAGSDSGTGGADGSGMGGTDGSGAAGSDGVTGGADGSGSDPDGTDPGSAGFDAGNTDSSAAQEPSSNTIAMVFDSSGTLVYNVHIENGTVVDANGNPVPGCSVNENGYVVDAYMNVINPATGELMQ